MNYIEMNLYGALHFRIYTKKHLKSLLELSKLFLTFCNIFKRSHLTRLQIRICVVNQYFFK